MRLSSGDHAGRASARTRHRKWLRSGLAAVLSMATLAALAAPASATDTMPWGGQYADTSHPEQSAGANQPYQHGYTGLDILNWNPDADKDSEYLRSRVPLQTRIAANAATQKDPNLPADTEMFNLAGDYGNAFFESFHDNNVFSQYLFNYWQYTDYYGTWHGQPTANVPKSLYDEKAQSDWTQKWFEFGTLNLPNAAYTNVAHKNGAKSIATIFYSGNDRGEQTYKDLLQGKRADGTYLVADKLVEIAKYYGFDGYFVNQESSVNSADVPAYQDFMKQIIDQGIYIQWYDSATYPNGGVSYQNMFNDANSPWVQDPNKGKISDSIFLNYWFSGNMLQDSADHAKSLGIDPKYAVFAGIEAGQKKFGSIASNANYMNVNLDADGKPYVSLAALGTDFVSHELGDDKKVYPKYQNQVFDRERRLWTGSSTGEKGTTDISDPYIDDGTSSDSWKGFASQIAERSVIGGPVFSTSFNTGHGLEWRDNGEQTSNQQWGNINLQDILPTWQWWIDADSDPLQADFDYGKDYEAVPRFKYTKVGGYEGGDSLVLSGKLSNDNTIRLYKTDLDVAAGSKIDLTYNKLNSDDSKLQLGLILADDPETVVPVDVTDGSAGNGWKTASVDLSQYAGKKTGTLKLYAVGADGSRSLATEAPLNEAAAVSDVKVEPGKDGNVKVSWTNPQVSGEKTVTVKSDTGSWRYAAKPYSQTVKVAADKSKVTIANAPVDSSRYVVNVDNAGGTTATATGAFADAAIEPYPACSVIWNGDNVTLARPETQDWRYLYMTEKWIGENGKQQQENQLGASYTYSQSTPPITGIIRGRTTPSSYTKSIPSGHELWVQVEDYNGNKTEPVKIQTADELAKCTVSDPTQPDAKESTLTAVDGSAVADGKATRTIQATVKDSFGNPLTNAEVAFTLPEGVTAVDGNATVKTDAAGVASLNVVSTKVGKYTVKAALGDKSIGEGVAIEFTKVAATPNKPGQPDKPNKPGDNKPGQNNNKNNDKNGASDSSLSKTGSSIIAIVTAAVVLLGAGTVVLRARSKME